MGGIRREIKVYQPCPAARYGPLPGANLAWKPSDAVGWFFAVATDVP